MKYTYYMLVFLVANVILIVVNMFITWSYKRKEDYAVITNKSGETQILKIKTSRDHFKTKKCAYIVPSETHKYAMKIRRKRYFRYIEGVPEPMLWWTDEKPAIPGDVFHSIIESNALKLLNTPPLMKNIWIWVLIGAGVIVAIFLFSRGN